MDDSLFSLYLSYKKATKVVLDWLVSAVGYEQFRKAHPWPTTMDIVMAATVVRDQKHIVPQYVLSNLRDGLRRRRKVHSLYVELHDPSHHEENLKHQAFIDRLEQIYQILLPLAEVPRSSLALSSNQTETPQSTGANRYASLTDTNLTGEGDDPDVTIQWDSTTEDAPSTENTEQVLRDDQLGEYIELSLFVYQLDAICAKVNEYWTNVASGNLSMAVAGFLTNTAYHAVQRIVESSPILLSDNELLYRKWYFTKRDFRIRFTDIPELQSGYARFSEDMGLWRYWRILHDCRTLSKYKEIHSNAGRRQDPAAFIRKSADGCEDSAFDDLALDKMQESMRQLLCTGRAISQLEEEPMRAEPLLPALDAALQDRDSPIPTHLVFGMEMLLSSYKAYLWPSGHKSNCRILSLRFANDVLNSIRQCVQFLERLCLCQDTDHCTCLQKEWICKFQYKLQAYVQENRFDLYYQAPWVAAGHMTEVLYWSMYEGIDLCCGTNYVTAVLHLYNALREVSPNMRRVLWLDQMCDIFTDSLFLGSLPKTNFSSVFRRASGGQLLKSYSLRGGTRRFAKGTPVISRRQAGVIRLSMFYAQHRMNYQLTPGFLAQLHLGRKVNKATPSQTREALNWVNSTVWPVTMERIKEALQPEFQGKAPIARLDFFAIFRNCIRILEELSTRLDRNKRVSAHLGFELVDSLLTQIAEHERDARLARMLPQYLPLSQAALTFASFDETHDLSTFAWKI